MPHPVAPAILRRRGVSLALAFFLWAAVLQFVIKLLLAQAAGSLSLLACALHTLLLCFSALISLQSLWHATPVAQGNSQSPIKVKRSSPNTPWVNSDPAAGKDIGGQLETLTALLMWAILGFGGFSLLGEVLRRGWKKVATLPLESDPSLSSTPLSSIGSELGGAAIAPVQSLPPRLLPLLVALAILGFCLAFFAHICARQFANRKIAFQGYLLLQDGWLLLLAMIGIVGVGQGLPVLESVAAVGILAIVLGDACRWLNVHVPHWWGHMAIAPEAIVATVQQVDGVLGCQVLHCRGMVGRGLTLSLELRLHPEFESLRHQLGKQVCQKLENRYGPTQAAIYLISQIGGRRRRLKLNPAEQSARTEPTEDSQ